MNVDPSGHKHEWVGWLISGLEIALGFALITTGVGVGAGLTLVGTGVGSVVTDCIDLGWNNVDWGKAACTSLITGAFNILPSMLSKFLDKNSINNLVFNAITLYDTLLVSTANSIVNVFWRG